MQNLKFQNLRIKCVYSATFWKLHLFNGGFFWGGGRKDVCMILSCFNVFNQAFVSCYEINGDER